MHPREAVSGRYEPADVIDRKSVAFVLGLCALALLPTLSYRLGTDQGVFAYMGAALTDGRRPYLQTWESDFPGLMFLQAAEILLLGRSIVMFRLFDLVVQLGNAYLIYRITTKVSESRSGGCLAAVLFCLIYQGYGPWNTAQREGFGLLFLLGGFWMCLTRERRPAWLTAGLAGLGIGVAVLIKPTLLCLAAFYAPLGWHLTRRSTWFPAAVAAAAVAAPMASVMIWYWVIGGFPQFYEACVSYQHIYTALLRGSEPLPIFWLHKLQSIGRNAFVLPFVYAAFLIEPRRRTERGMLLLGYLGATYAVFVQGTFAGYHYLPGLGVGAIAIGDMFSTVTRLALAALRPSLAMRRWLPALLAGVLLAAAAATHVRRESIENLIALRFLEPPLPNEFRNATVFDFTEDFDVAAYLRSHTSPEDPVQVWGYESLVYYLAERYASSRFQMTTPLVIRPPGADLAPMQRRWRAEFLGDIERRPPAYVAVVRQDRWWWAPEQRSSEQLLDDFPEWKTVIDREYRLEQTLGRFLIYRRRVAADRLTKAAMQPPTDER